MSVHNAETGRRTMQPVPPGTHRLCYCGCGKRASHIGMADGAGMTVGCEWSVRLWVRDGTASILRRLHHTRASNG